MPNVGVKLDRKALRDARIRAGFSLRQLSVATKAAGREIEIDYLLLADYENGVHSPTPRSLFYLAKALGVEVDDLRAKDGEAA